MIPRRMQRVVSDDPGLAALWNQTKPLRELQKLFVACVPPNLCTVSRVGSVAGEELKLLADTGAAATRLRLLAPELLAEFRRKGWEFSAIRVAVQVRTRAGTASKTPPKTLDAQGRQALEKLADTLPESALRDAISRLAGRR